ncbi:phage tail tape measure protein [Phascolarctobacterium faecium]|uniref:phage tail tape measure protein n=1 Tax=Phascolarctobacterium faecium TaxID=33025 RepID=UPI002E8DCEFF|nr:phage tail tape measure protein [Phascolarctobacterium faecium]
MESAMGLGFVLEFKDMASSGIEKAKVKIDELKQHTADLTSVFDKNLTRIKNGAAQMAIGFTIMGSMLIPTMNAALGQYKMAEVSTLLAKNQMGLVSQLSDTANAAAMKFGKKTDEMASAEYNLISAGIDAAKVNYALDASAKLAIGGITDMGTASNGLTSVLNAYNLAAEQSEEVTDAMFVAMKRGKTTIGELSGVIGRVAPLASNVGVSINEMFGSIATATLSGQKTEEAATGLKAALSNIMKPTSEGAKLADSLGLAFDAEALKAKGLRGVLDDVYASTKGDVGMMTQLFGSVEALNFVFAIMKNNGDTFTSVMNDMNRKGGSTEEAYRKMADTVIMQGRRIGASFAVGMKRFGTIFLPVLSLILWPLELIMKGFASLPKPILGVIGAGLGFASLFLIMRGAMMASYGASKLLSAGIGGQFVASLKKGTLGLLNFNSGFAKTSLRMFGHMALLYALYKAYDYNFLGIKTAVSRLSAAWDIASNAADDGTVKIKKSLIKDLGFSNVEYGADVLERLGAVFFRVQQFAKSFGQGVGNEFAWLGKQLDKLKQDGGPIADLLSGLLNIDRSKLSDWKEIGFLFGQFAVYIVPLLLLSSAFSAVSAIVGGIIAPFSALFGILGSLFGFIVANPIVLVIAGIAIAAWRLYENWDAVCAYCTDLWNSFSLFITSTWDGIVSYGNELWSGFCAFLQDMWNGVVNFFSAYGQILFGTMLWPFSMIVAFFTSFRTTFFTSGASLWDAFCAGIKSAVNGPIDAVREGLARIRRMLPFSDAKEGPLSTLTLSGSRLMTTLATGVNAGSPALQSAVEKGFSSILPHKAKVDVLPAYMAAKFPVMPKHFAKVVKENDDNDPVGGRPDFIRNITNRFVSEKRTVVDHMLSAEKQQEKPFIVESIVYLDGEQIYRAVKRVDKFERFKDGDDRAV